VNFKLSFFNYNNNITMKSPWAMEAKGAGGAPMVMCERFLAPSQGESMRRLK
jgi:hypothetical protein